MKIKNPFKKQGVMATLTNVSIGGAANVAIDYAVSQVDALSGMSDTVISAGKLLLGAIGGSMTTNPFVRAAADGVAVVGASELVKGLISDEEQPITTETTSGLPKGTVGNIRFTPGNRTFRRKTVSGVSAAAVMGK